MKRFFFIAAIAGAALASCTKTEVAPVAEKAISFAAPVVGPQTKAVYGEIPTAYNENEQFAVYAVHSQGNYTTWGASTLYMGTTGEGLTVLKATGENYWAPTTPYYWPKEGKLSFAAYSPADVNGEIAYDANGLSVEGHEVSSDITEHVDFLYAPRVLNYTASTVAGGDEANDDDTQYKYDGVNILFKHALSSIVFQVARDAQIDENTVITLNKITLNQPNCVANFNETITDGAEYAAVPAWSEWSTPKDLETYNTPVAITTTHTEYVKKVDDKAADIIVIPQVLSSNVKVTLDYDITTPGNHTVNQVTSVQLNGFTTQWLMGMRYTYKITIGLDEIKFDPAVTDWVDATVPGITI